MKFDCELIQDLLPLYEEELCSEATRRAVETHFQECAHCRRLSAPLPIEVPGEPPTADRAVKKSMKKVRRRWLASLLAAVLAVPLLLMCFNQYRGSGLCFTNLDDIHTARCFFRALESENWEEAAKMHDFSRSYESILDALGMEASGWGTSFTRCDVAGYAYAARGTLARAGLVPGTVEELYGYLYNLQGSAMVPVELWAELMAIDPGAFSQNSWQYWLNGEVYGKVSTPWGEYVVSRGRGYDTAVEYAANFELIPAAIYEEAQPALEAEAQELYDRTHSDVGWVAELTEAEFTEEMVRRYTADLKELEDRVSFECTGYQGAYWIRENDGWHVQFGVTLTYQGKSLDTVMSLGVQDGRVRIVSLSHPERAEWLDDIDRALYPSAHSGY